MNDLPIVSSSGSPPGMERRPKSSSARSSGATVGRVIFVLVTFCALIVLSWFVWSINSVLNERTTDLVESAERIAALEMQFSTNTEIFAESGESMNEQISYWESETRKVWANYQKHKNWIEENEPIIVQLGKDFDSLKNQLKSIQDSLTDTENSVTQIIRQQRSLTDDLNTNLQRTTSLLEQLDLRVQRHEKDIESFDDYRVQTNRTILDLRRRLENLELNN